MSGLDFSGGDAPLVRGLLDTDLYKLLMLQLIWRRYPRTRVTFSLVNRTRTVALGRELEVEALRAELDHVRTLRVTPDERAWLETAEVYGRTDRFAPDFLDWLETLRLPDYELHVRKGQVELAFHGSWAETTLWEIPALVAVTGSRARHALAQTGPVEREHLYACALGRLEAKAERLRSLPDLALTDFGTRRRHSFPWQRQCLQTFQAELGPAFRGTSNLTLARELGLPPVGTNGHELPMVLAALAADDAALARAPYRVLEDWAELYDGPMRIILPDTFGSAAFFRDAPPWVAGWRGVRPDSAPAAEAGEALIAWWRSRGCDPRDRLIIFSDALELEDIETLHGRFNGRVGLSFGWGTRFTNDLEGCAEAPGLKPISLVCKVTEADGRPAVKLSDNPAKATGDPREIARYRHVFDEADGPARALTV